MSIGAQQEFTDVALTGSPHAQGFTDVSHHHVTEERHISESLQ